MIDIWNYIGYCILVFLALGILVSIVLTIIAFVKHLKGKTVKSLGVLDFWKYFVMVYVATIIAGGILLSITYFLVSWKRVKSPPPDPNDNITFYISIKGEAKE